MVYYFKQKTAYEVRIIDWSSDVCSSDLLANYDAAILAKGQLAAPLPAQWLDHADALNTMFMFHTDHREAWASAYLPVNAALRVLVGWVALPALTGPLLTLLGALALWRSEEHTSELQSLMRISYAVFCLTKKK